MNLPGIYKVSACVHSGKGLRELPVIGVLTGETVTPAIPGVGTIVEGVGPSLGIDPCFST
jgi:hypothetical protein